VASAVSTVSTPLAAQARLQTTGFTAITLRVAHNMIFTAWKDSA
jgi:hypothetical protein